MAGTQHWTWAHAPQPIKFRIHTPLKKAEEEKQNKKFIFTHTLSQIDKMIADLDIYFIYHLLTMFRFTFIHFFVVILWTNQHTAQLMYLSSQPTHTDTRIQCNVYECERFAAIDTPSMERNEVKDD